MKKSFENIKRYSDQELENFRQVILNKLEAAQNEIRHQSLANQFHNSNGTDDTATSHNTLEEGADTLGREVFIQILARQQKFIEQLNAALGRVANKTYGICTISGNLIPVQRLMAVPHTTKSIEAKLQQDK